jgi:Na+/H+ antiporter NhaA/predicted MPP superfamily phosphohydrolase
MRRAILVVAVLFIGAARVPPPQTGAPIPAVVQRMPLRADSLKFAVIGDNGTGEKPQYDVGQQMANARALFPFDMVIMLGDNMYGRQAPEDFVSKFERPYAALLERGVLFYASLGNHDNQNNRYYKGFNMGGERYFTFVKKNVRFFVLDTNQLDPKQRSWFDEALQQSHDDWRICYFHHPLYSDGGRHGADVALRVALEPLLVKYGVNVVFSGHDHVYERVKPQKGIAYFVAGSGGELRRGDVHRSAETAAYFDQDQAFMLVEVTGDDLYFEAVARTGAIVDAGVIHRQSGRTEGYAMKHHAALARPLAVHHRRRKTGAGLLERVTDHYVALPVGVAIALVWSNTVPEQYFVVSQSLAFAVNDVAMTLFFGLIMQEVVEATMPGGALHSWRRWTLPLIGAAGGVAGSVGVYLAYVHSHYEAVLAPGWLIASAVDIAAAYYVLKMILPRSGALPFVLLLAIGSDLFGMLMVAPSKPTFSAPGGGVLLMLAALGLAAVMRSMKVRAFWPYLAICGVLSWVAFFREGLHPAFALVPIVPFLPHEPRGLNLLADPPDDDAVHHFEHEWNALVQGILLLFGVVNGGVMLRGYDTGTWALLLAALVGRPLGIVAAVGAAVAAGWQLPKRLGWRQLAVTALAASSGFTFALFFASGILSTGPVLAQLTIGALGTAAGSLLAFGAARMLRVGRFAR